MIESSVRGGVMVIRLARTERANALVPEFLNALNHALQHAQREKRPVVLIGSGRAFCTGADLKWLASCSDPAVAVAELVAVYHTAIAAMLDMPAPVISAINGTVAGGGMGLALAADYCIAAEAASFTAAYFRLGLTPDGGSSAFLERTIGAQRTMELLLTNRRLLARQALEWGMVNEVVPDAQLEERAVAFAGDLHPVPGYALLQTRRLLDMSYIRNQLQLESVAIRTAARGARFRQAIQEFRAAHPD